MTSQSRTLTPADQLKLFVGLAVQPFLAAAVAFVSFPLVLLDRAGRTLAGGFPSDPTDAAISVALGVGVVALFVTLVGVLPTAVWVAKHRRLTLAIKVGFRRTARLMRQLSGSIHAVAESRIPWTPSHPAPAGGFARVREETRCRFI